MQPRLNCVRILDKSGFRMSRFQTSTVQFWLPEQMFSRQSWELANDFERRTARWG